MNVKELSRAAAKTLGSGYKLARTLGVTDATVSGWRNGKHNADAPHIFKMMEIAERKKQKGLATTALLIAIATTIAAATMVLTATDKSLAISAQCILCQIRRVTKFLAQLATTAQTPPRRLCLQ